MTWSQESPSRNHSTHLGHKEIQIPHYQNGMALKVRTFYWGILWPYAVSEKGTVNKILLRLLDSLYEFKMWVWSFTLKSSIVSNFCKNSSEHGTRSLRFVWIWVAFFFIVTGPGLIEDKMLLTWLPRWWSGLSQGSRSMMGRRPSLQTWAVLKQKHKETVKTLSSCISKNK